MKRSSAVLLCAAALAACGPQKEKAPNHDFTQATPVRPGKVVGTIASPDEADFFRVDVAQQQSLSVHVGGIRDVDFVLSVYDGNRVELLRADETAAGGDEELLDIGVNPGPYYVVLRNKNPKANNPTQQYQLDVKLDRPTSRERKPDFTAQTASPLELPGVTRGHFWPAQNLLSGDTDYAAAAWFRVEISTGIFLLNLDLSEVPKVDPVIDIFDLNGYKLKEIDSGGVGEGESLKSFGVRGPALYNLKLFAKNRAGNPDVPFELLTELIFYQGRTEFEPNDQRQDATPFEGDAISGAIAPEGDADWYKVSARDPQRQILRASVTGVEGLDLTLTLTDSFGNPLAVVDNMPAGQPEVLTGYGVTAGDYYLVVQEKTGRKQNAREPYTLAKTITPWQPGLEWEPNESTATAQALKVGESADGYVAPKGDADFYQFNVYQKGTVSFELAGVLNVQFVVDLYDQESKAVQQWSAPKQGESMAFERELDAGTYYLKLSAKDASQNNVRDKYSLRLRVR